MSYFFRNRIWTAIIIVVLAANFVTLIYFWTVQTAPAPPAAPLPPDPGPPSPANYIVNQLKFTPEQEVKFDALRKEHQQQVGTIRDSIRLAKDQLFALVNANASEAEIMDASAKAAYYHQKIDLLTFRHFQKVKAICTPVQQKEFASVINRIVEQMAPPPPPMPSTPAKPGRLKRNRVEPIPPPPPVPAK